MEDHGYHMLTALPDPDAEPQDAPPTPLFDRRPLTPAEWFVWGAVAVAFLFAGFIVFGHGMGWF